jgi:hypothetical protein
MFMQKILVFISFLSYYSSPIFGQITSPGIGKNHLASWLAVGIRQDLDSTGRKESMTYVGFGRSSHPNNYNLFQRPSIFVLNEEFHHRFARNWQYGIALSYRRQNEYNQDSPFTPLHPRVIQEFRFYARASYVYELPRMKFAFTAREELRNFFSPTFRAMDQNIELRTRIRAQVKVNLDRRKVHKIEFSIEPLFRTQHRLSTTNWSNFAYTETRFTLFYTLAPKKIPFVFDFGYMNYLVGNAKPSSTHYIGFDIVWNNPFGKPHKNHSRPIEYLE